MTFIVLNTSDFFTDPEKKTNTKAVVYIYGLRHEHSPLLLGCPRPLPSNRKKNEPLRLKIYTRFTITHKSNCLIKAPLGYDGIPNMFGFFFLGQVTHTSRVETRATSVMLETQL